MNGRQRRLTTKTNREEGEGTQSDHILGRTAFHPVKTNQGTLRYKSRYKGMNRQEKQTWEREREKRVSQPDKKNRTRGLLIRRNRRATHVNDRRHDKARAGRPAGLHDPRAEQAVAPT
ncbi:hypothetical protein RUM43_008747 [Polyplax serrata]|uniref:Uncharacterized protein n=1 Tax=Polyplax serrata TaxID=468196 RepID=A0AAN8NYW3_POLSC